MGAARDLPPSPRPHDRVQPPPRLLQLPRATAADAATLVSGAAAVDAQRAVLQRKRGTAAAEPVDTSTPVLVLTASPRARRSPHGGMGIMRSLGRLGVPIYTVDSDPRGPAAHSRYIRRRFLFDLATAEPEAIVAYLLDVGRRLDGRPVLIPTWDEASILVSEHADALEEVFTFPRQPAGLPRSLASKKEMFALAGRHGVPTPDAVFPAGPEDVRAFVAGAAFPVMLKAISGNRLLERAGRKMLIVHDADELLRAYEEMEDPDAPNLMLQEYIPGGEDAVWMFNGYFDGASDCLFGITGRKLRQTPIYTGATSLGVCQENPTVEDTTRRWMKELGYRGILDIGYRYDARDGRYKVLDVNPRIGGTFRLFVADNGMDVARALYLDLTGQRVTPGRPVYGRKWMDSRDLQTALQHRRAGDLTIRRYVNSVLGVRETVYFAVDDPAPFVQHMRYLLSQTVRSAARPAASGTNGSSAPMHAPWADRRSRAQADIDRRFEAASEGWRTIYQERSVVGVIYQERMATALRWIDALGLPTGTPVLEVGCGAGLTAAALAERGLHVTAVDSAPAMLELTQRLAREQALAGRLETRLVDTHQLPFDDGAFELVLALGVIPWLHAPAAAIGELARVTRPGGRVIASSDNLLRLNHLLDPRLNPLTARSRRLVGGALRRVGLRSGSANPGRLDPPWRLQGMVDRSDLARERETTLGFGPFTFLLRPMFSQGDGIRLHRALQTRADRGSSPLRWLGAQHLLMARRPLRDAQEETTR